jgi:hypothetical protein
VAKRVTLETSRTGAPVRGAIEGTAKALREAASWVGAEQVRIDEVIPATAAKALRALA